VTLRTLFRIGKLVGVDALVADPKNAFAQAARQVFVEKVPER
jgi:hypothetical protein